MFIGYIRVSKADGSQVTDLQLDALLAAGVERDHIYEDHASGAKDDRPQVGVYFTFQKLQHELLGAPESLQGIQQSSKSLNCADE
jgi:hypothetical protein